MYVCVDMSSCSPLWHHPSLRRTCTLQILQSQGKYQLQPPRPFVLGSELAGRVAADSPIPDGCPFRPGDRVFGAAQGAFAEKVAVNWQALVSLPDNMTYDQGAGMSLICLLCFACEGGKGPVAEGEC